MALSIHEREEIGRRYWTERESPSVLADDFKISREWAQKVAKANKPDPTQQKTPDAEADRGSVVIPTEGGSDQVGTRTDSTPSA